MFTASWPFASLQLYIYIAANVIITITVLFKFVTKERRERSHQSVPSPQNEQRNLPELGTKVPTAPDEQAVAS